MGGFAASPLLQERVKREFSDKVTKVVFPSTPGVAVMLGASYFGLDPRSMIRRSRTSYGVQLCNEFVPGTDLESQRGEGAEADRCPRIFHPFVKVGDLIPYDEPRTVRLNAVFPQLRTALLPIYVSDRNGVRYTDEKGVRRLAEIIVDEMPTDGAAVEVSMFFGRTEFTVIVLNLATKKEIMRTLKYTCESTATPFSPFTLSSHT